MLALLFPGQASQTVGMGVDLRAASAAARRIFELADAITGLPITRLTEQGPLEALTETAVAQPAVVATSLAALEVLSEHAPVEAAAVAGHSVGEFSAYVAAGVIDAQTALELVHVRAQAMAAACSKVDGTMAAVIGLDEAAVVEVCQGASRDGSSVELANLNAPGNLIVSGARDAIDRLTEIARQAGARRVLPLNVGGPFHSVYMRQASTPLRDALVRTTLHTARVPVVLNATARPATDPDVLRAELVRQVYSPVRWIETLRRLEALGCDHFLEVGPGTVLSGLVKRTLPDAHVSNFGSTNDLPAAQSVL